MGTLNAAESRVTVARLSLDQTRKEFERTEALYAKGVVIITPASVDISGDFLSLMDSFETRGIQTDF